MKTQSSTPSKNSEIQKFTLNHLASALPNLSNKNQNCEFEPTKQGNLTSSQKISNSENMYFYKQRTLNGQSQSRADMIKTMRFRGTVMKLRTGSFFGTPETDSPQKNEICPLLTKNAKKTRTHSNLCISNKNCKNTEFWSNYENELPNFAKQNSYYMNKDYSTNSVNGDSNVRRCLTNMNKPWSIFINDHATIDVNNQDNGLKQMSLGLYKTKNLAQSFLSLISGSSKGISRKCSIQELENEESPKENLEKPEIEIAMPKPTRPVPTLFGNLLRVPTTKSIGGEDSEDPEISEKKEKTSFWNSLFMDNDSKSENDQNLLSPEDQNIFRPRTSVSRSFFREEKFMPSSTTKNMDNLLVLEKDRSSFLSIPTTDEEIAVESVISCKKRKIRKCPKGIEDSSVFHIIKHIGTRLVADKVTGMRGFKNAMLDLVNGPKTESKNEPKNEKQVKSMCRSLSNSKGFFGTPDLSKNCHKNVKSGYETTGSTLTKSHVFTTPNVSTKNPKLAPLDIKNGSKNRILKGTRCLTLKNSMLFSETDTPGKRGLETPTTEGLTKYCHRLSGSVVLFDPLGSSLVNELKREPSQPVRVSPKTCLVKKKTNKARKLIFNFEEKNSSVDVIKKITEEDSGSGSGSGLKKRNSKFRITNKK